MDINSTCTPPPQGARSAPLEVLAGSLAASSVIVAVADTDRREQLAEYGRAAGYRVTSTASGLEVLQLLADALLYEERLSSTPGLLIMDNRLPGVLGRSIAEGVRDLGWTTPIVLLGDEGVIGGDSWTLSLPSGTRTRSVWTASRALVERHAVSAPAEELFGDRVPGTLGVVGFRWDAQNDLLEMVAPLQDVSSLWSGTLAQWLGNVHPKDRTAVARRLLRLENGLSRRLTLQVRWRARSGRYRWVEIRGHKPNASSIAGAVVDIDRLKRRELSFELAARRDGMTKLCNRGEFEHRLHLLAKRKAEFAMLFIDLNDFKQINDELGHLAGDELLRRVGDRLRKCIRREDHLGRLGGDEFGVLITGPFAAARMADVEERIHTAIGFPFTIAERTFSISASVGSVDSLAAPGSPPQIWEAADRAMYRNKRGRKSSVPGRTRTAS